MLVFYLWRNVEASCHTHRRRLPPSTNSAAYQRLVSSTRHGPSQLACPAVIDQQPPIHPDCDLCLPTCNQCPHLEGPRWNIAMTFGVKKLDWFGNQVVKKNLTICLFVFTEFVEFVTQTDGWTD